MGWVEDINIWASWVKGTQDFFALFRNFFVKSEIISNCSPPGFSVHGIFPGKNTGMGSHSLLQGIFSTQGLNSSLLHCRQILYCLNDEINKKPPS